MGILSWFFPTDDDRLESARALMKAGRYEDARNKLMRSRAPEAEALYDECCAAVDKTERASMKKHLAAQGFHGWKVEISGVGKNAKSDLERLVTQELVKGGVDLALPEIDEKAFKSAVNRAQRRSQKNALARVLLVPIVDGELAKR
jgi:hypothetical protein